MTQERRIFVNRIFIQKTEVRIPFGRKSLRLPYYKALVFLISDKGIESDDVVWFSLA
jgi:hypothetical protein